jgi:hypothetical protein
MQDTGKWIEDDGEDIALGEVSRHCAGKSGPLEPEAALLYTELCAGKGENGFMKINCIVSCKKKKGGDLWHGRAGADDGLQ